ncbi:MAG: endonuclease/exonuclease/phosphatase family protein [Myxococcaceae bacterium]|nr:endonuclease/exonuclease/phosphatase family protein [Myxococcaceae bacterium]
MRLWWVAVVVLVSCGAPPSSVDAGPDGSSVSSLDAGAMDGSVASHDAGGDDGGDAGLDAGAADAGTPDASAPDASMADAGGPDAGAPDASIVSPDGGVRVRLIAANLTSGNNQTYDLGEGRRILQALQGDIIGIQEFNVGDNSDASVDTFVLQTFDAGFFWHRGSGRIPNGVISRYPIVDAGEWDDTRTTDREFTWAVVDVPGPAHVWVVSLHLLSNTAQNRANQAAQLTQLLAANVGPGTHVALLGDLNTDTRVEPALGALDASVVVAAPWPTDGTLSDGGNGNTSTNRSRPYDWVLVSPSLHAREVPVLLGSQLFPSGLVFDTRVFTPLPPPALPDDSAAVNMQHMAVVRDFTLGP